MSTLFIAFLAVVAEIALAVICIKEIAKDIRYNIRRYKLTCWASKMLKEARERREQRSIIPFEKAENTPETDCINNESPSPASEIIPFHNQAM